MQLENDYSLSGLAWARGGGSDLGDGAQLPVRGGGAAATPVAALAQRQPLQLASCIDRLVLLRRTSNAML